jgi:serine/threonine protein kinase/Leucine-rich repeat (LRR) protein
MTTSDQERSAPQSADSRAASLEERIEAACARLEACWVAGERPRIETFTEAFEPHELGGVVQALIEVDLWHRRRKGEVASIDEYIARFPTLRDVLAPASAAFTHSVLEADQPTGVISDPAATDNGLSKAPPSPPHTVRPGNRLGDYEILSELGRGGMGVVHRARHRLMKRIVALKVLSPELQRDPEALARFRREVVAAASLSHANIVTAYDAQEIDGVAFLVMEFVPGVDLATWVKWRGPLPIDMAIDCILQAARGLEYAHRRKVIHRDIKPHNLLYAPPTADGESDEFGTLAVPHGAASSTEVEAPMQKGSAAPRGTVKILDMGLARVTHADDAEGSAGLTRTGAIMGTADYIAPEQALDTHTADARSDIYSLGCTLWFLLTGRPLYPGGTIMQKFVAHREASIPSLADALRTSNLSAGSAPQIDAIDAVFRRMVAKKPQDRFQTAGELIDVLVQTARINAPAAATTERIAPSALDEFLQSQLTQTTTPLHSDSARATSSGDAQSRRTRPERKLLPWGIAGCLAFLLIAGVAFNLKKKDPQSPREPATGSPVVNRVKTGESVGETRPQGPELSSGTSANPRNAHREAAEMVLKRGGSLNIQTIDRDRDVAVGRLAELPDEDFVVTSVQLANRKEFRSPDLKAFSGLTYLKVFGLAGTSIDNSGLKYISQIVCPSLDLSYTAITDRGLRELSNKSDLVTLQIGGNAITDAACETLAGFEYLQRLNLGSTAIGDRGLAHLTRLKVLSCLHVGSNCTGRGLLHLQHLEALTKLDMGSFAAGPQDVEPLGQLTQLRAVTLSDRTSDDVAIELQKVLPLATIAHPRIPMRQEERESVELLLRGNAWLYCSSQKLDAVPPFSRHIHGVQWTVNDGAECAPLTKLPELEDLYLSDLKNADLAAEAVSTLSGLTFISFKTSDLTATGVEHLTALKSLGSLRLVGCSSLNDASLSPLTRFPCLHTLDLSRSSVTDSGLVHIGRHPGLQSVTLDGCRQITSEGVKHLAEMPMLRMLDMRLTSLDDTAAAPLRQISSLRLLDLRNSGMTRVGVEEIQRGLPRCAILWDEGIVFPDPKAE